MFTLYSQAMKTRDRVNKDMDILLSNRLVMEHITRELRAGMQYDLLNMGLNGSVETAEWVSAQIPGPQAWASKSMFKDSTAPETDIQIVGYRLRYGTDEQGQSVIEGLERTCRKVLLPISSAKDDEGNDQPEEDVTKFTIDAGIATEVEFITPQVKLLRFRYWDGNAWLTSWSGGDLPGAVEITIGPTALPADQTLDDFEGEFFQRVVYISTGFKNSAGSSGLTSEGGE